MLTILQKTTLLAIRDQYKLRNLKGDPDVRFVLKLDTQIVDANAPLQSLDTYGDRLIAFEAVLESEIQARIARQPLKPKNLVSPYVIHPLALTILTHYTVLIRSSSQRSIALVGLRRYFQFSKAVHALLKMRSYQCHLTMNRHMRSRLTALEFLSKVKLLMEHHRSLQQAHSYRDSLALFLLQFPSKI